MVGISPLDGAEDKLLGFALKAKPVAYFFVVVVVHYCYSGFP